MDSLRTSRDTYQPRESALTDCELLSSGARFMFEVERCWPRGSCFDPVPEAAEDYGADGGERHKVVREA
jgi:hypothetical protein